MTNIAPMRAVIYMYICCLLATPVHADIPVPADSAIQDISSTKEWKKLLGFRKDKSDVTEQSFFLSKRGAFDATAELKKTLEAFALPSGEDPNTHAQCRYPARYLYLNSKFDFAALGITEVVCPDFKSFSSQGAVSSISILFASGFLENPASYYGHMLIKLNIGQTPNSTLLDTAINYGAAYPPDENMLVYIGKGIFGGYSSRFTEQDFYYHLHNYSDGDLRDIWEYELDLTNDEIRLFTAYLWELFSVKHQYFFLNRNCAYRIAEALELVVSAPLAYPHRPWEAPQSIMQRLSKVVVDNRPLVKKITYIPSRQSRLYQRFLDLGPQEQSRLRSWVTNSSLLPPSDQQNSLQSDSRVLDTLIDYYKFRGADKESAAPTLKQAYKDTLSSRFNLPISDEWMDFSSDNRPHLGHAPSLFSISALYHKNFNEGVSLQLRPAYYDALDSEYGQIKNSALSMAEIRLTSLKDKVFVDQFSLVSIRSVGRNITQLPGDNHKSWSLYAGAEQKSLACIDCLAFSANGSIGKNIPLQGDTIGLSAFIGIGYLGNNLIADEIYAEGTTRLNINLPKGIRIEVDNSLRQFVNGSDISHLANIQSRVPFGKNRDLRLSFKKNKDYQFSLSTGFYW